MRNQYKVLAEKYKDINKSSLSESIDWNSFPYGKVEKRAISYIKSKDPSYTDLDVKVIYSAFCEWLKDFEHSPGLDVQDWFENAVENYADSMRADRTHDSDDLLEDSIAAATQLLRHYICHFYDSKKYKDYLAASRVLYKDNPGVNIDI